METKTLKTIPKISVRIWTPVIEKLDEQIKSNCLRRDAFLNKVLAAELPRLDEEVSMSSSPTAQRYITEQLEHLPRKLVSLALDPELVSELNRICTTKGIVRDAFFNRLFLVLAAKPATIDRLFFYGESDWTQEVWNDWKVNGAENFVGDFYPLQRQHMAPFWAIREGLFRDRGDVQTIQVNGRDIRVTTDLTGHQDPVDSFYTRRFDQKIKEGSLIGFNCYLPDHAIPETEAARSHKAKLDEILAGEI